MEVEEILKKIINDPCHPDAIYDEEYIVTAINEQIDNVEIANALVLLYQLEIAKEILKANRLNNILLYQFRDSLTGNYSVSDGVALIAVLLWFKAYGVSTLDKEMKVNISSRGGDSVECAINAFEAIVDEEIEKIKNWEGEGENVLRINDSIEKVKNPLLYKSIVLERGEEGDIIDLSEMTNVESLSMYNDYKGRIPDMDYSNIRIINSYAYRSWNEFVEYLFCSLEELSISVYADEKPISLNAEKLKRLRINLINRDIQKPYLIDLSQYPMLEYVNISAHDSMKSIRVVGIEGVKTLILQNCGVIEDFTWICYANCLESLYIYGTKMQDLSSLRMLTNLKILSITRSNMKSLDRLSIPKSVRELDLSVNDIQDFSLLYDISGLETVKLYRNPAGKTDRKRIVADKLIFDNYDQALEECSRRMYNKIETVCRRILAMDRRAREILDSNREVKTIYEKNIIRNLEISIYDRAREMFEFEFRKAILNISPWDMYLTWIDYSPEFKDKFIKKMMKEYPFLKLNEEDRNQIEREKKSVFLNERKKLVCICEENIYSIYVKSEPGTGKWDIYKADDKDKKLFQKRLDSSMIYFLNGLGEYNFKIMIEKKYVDYLYINSQYVNYDMDKLFYPIVIAMVLSARNAFAKKTVVIADYKKNGSITQNKARRKDLIAAEYEGAEVAIIYGTSRTYKDMNLDEFGMRYMFAKNADDIIRIFLDFADVDA